MVKWVGFRSVAIANLRLPGHAESRAKHPKIAELASTYDTTDGPMNAPIVRAKTNELVAGLDRVLAARSAGRKSVTCRIVEGTDQEMGALREAENAFRRELTTAEREAAVRTYVRLTSGGKAFPDTVQKIGNEESEIPDTVQKIVDVAVHEHEQAAAAQVDHKRGRTPTAAPRRAAAAALGVSERTIRREAERQAAEAEAPKKPPLQSFGTDVPADIEARAGAIAKELSVTVEHLRLAMHSVGAAQDAGLPAFHAEILREAARAVWKQAQGLVPHSVCFWCKAQATEQCRACHGTGLAIGQDLRSAPEPLRHGNPEQPAEIFVDGAFQKAKPSRRKLVIEDELGNPLPVITDDSDIPF